MKNLFWKVPVVSLVLLFTIAGVSLAGKKGGPSYSPTSTIGLAHLSMYNDVTNFGPDCKVCHEGLTAPPVLTDPNADMKPNKACSECHPKGGKPDLFISHMKSRNWATPSYSRCTDCHKVSN